MANSKQKVIISATKSYEYLDLSTSAIKSEIFKKPYDVDDRNSPPEYVEALKAMGLKTGYYINGNLGRSLFPYSSSAISIDGQIHVYINQLGTINHQTVGVAHEFGHVREYLLGHPYQHPEVDFEVYNKRAIMARRLGYDY